MPTASARVFSVDQIVSVFASSTSSIHNKLIEELHKGFINYSNKVVYVAPVVHLGSTDAANSTIPPLLGGGDVCLKSGYIIDDKYYVIKIAGGGFKDKQSKSSHPNSGAMLVFSQHTGALNAILLDNGVLTELRTAAASSLAAKYFAPTRITNIGIVGTGIQARYQLSMLQHVIPFKAHNSNINVYVYGRSATKCERYKQDIMQTDGIRCAIADSLNEIGSKCNLIIMCTSARSPVLKREHLKSENFQKHGLHINCIGADAHGKQELDAYILSSLADMIIVDSKVQCLDFGETQHVMKGRRSKDDVMGKIFEFGHVLSDDHLKRFRRNGVNDKRVTVFDSTGVAVQDVVIAKLVYETLLHRNGSKI